jgi:hypothetical protein
MSKISLAPDASGSGIFTIASPNSNTNRTLTLPDDTGTIVTNSGNQAGSFTTLNTSGAVVFNDAGADVDFRVEGDTDANLLFVDASTDRVGVGINAPSAILHTQQSSDGNRVTGLLLQNVADDPNSAVSLDMCAQENSTSPIITARITALRTATTNGPTDIVFSNYNDGISPSGLNERARITSAGEFLVGTTTSNPIDNIVAGCSLNAYNGLGIFSRSNGDALAVQRLTNDGALVVFYQDGSQEGTISVSGTTVSYNGGNLSRWAQLTTPKDDTPLFKGTVMSNLDEMNVYIAPTTYWTEEDELPEGSATQCW